MSPRRTARLTPARAVTPPKASSTPSTTTISPPLPASTRGAAGNCAASANRAGSNGAAHVSRAAASRRSDDISGFRRFGDGDGVLGQSLLRLQFAHERDHAPAEELDLFLKMQEAEQ